MSQTPVTSEENYSAIVEVLLRSHGVSHAQGMFRSAGQLRVHNRIFAMLVNGNLVVKLPRERVDALVSAGDGLRFDPGHGRIMKEWVSVGPDSKADWMSLSHEALNFIDAKYEPILK